MEAVFLNIFRKLLLVTVLNVIAKGNFQNYLGILNQTRKFFKSICVIMYECTCD